MTLWDFLFQPEAIVAGALWSTICVTVLCLSLLVITWWQDRGERRSKIEDVSQ